MGFFDRAAPSQSAGPAPDWATEVGWEQIGPGLLDKRVHLQWAQTERFEGGTVVGYAADMGGLNLILTGDRSITFLRGGRDSPRIWIIKD